MDKIYSLKNKQGEVIYPRTLTNAVYDEEGNRLDNLIGTLANLTTEERVSLVRAINEIDGNAKAHKADYVQQFNKGFPSQAKDLKNNKTYTIKLQLSSEGNPQLSYEEVV